jgi:AraC-like DNA-binding protein
MESKEQRIFENGTMDATMWQCDEIRIGHALSNFTTLFSFGTGNDSEVVRMHFGLKGDYRFTHKQLNRSFDLIGSHHNMMYSKGFDMVVENKTLEIETFGIQFPKEQFLNFTGNANDQLKRFSEQIIDGKSVLFSESWGSVNSGIQQVIHQIIHSKFSGELQKLFLLSKSIELIVLCADSCRVSSEKSDLYIKTSTDKEKIIAARDLINNRANCPPNLSEIARMVGLNEYKLKKGFKEVFNNTVFGYLTDQRLLLAKQYLLDTNQTAAEISVQLGYATPQHFNNAFKKKFGITPFLVRNNP